MKRFYLMTDEVAEWIDGGLKGWGRSDLAAKMRACEVTTRDELFERRLADGIQMAIEALQALKAFQEHECKKPHSRAEAPD